MHNQGALACSCQSRLSSSTVQPAAGVRDNSKTWHGRVVLVQELPAYYLRNYQAITFNLTAPVCHAHFAPRLWFAVRPVHLYVFAGRTRVPDRLCAEGGGQQRARHSLPLA